MNRRRISPVLLFLVLFLAGKEVLWLSSFQLLQQRIADQWCINKYDAELMCGGSCYLFQQLEEVHEVGESPAELKINRLTALPLFLAPKWSAFSRDDWALFMSRTKYFQYLALLNRLFKTSLFIPPE